MKSGPMRQLGSALRAIGGAHQFAQRARIRRSRSPESLLLHPMHRYRLATAGIAKPFITYSSGSGGQVSHFSDPCGQMISHKRRNKPPMSMFAR
jgi:hypothetical protein